MQAQELDPVTHVPPIPAMTSEVERQCYYRLASEAEGAVIEFGAWMGASTAYIAAAMRDHGKGKMHTYDKFQVKKGHVKKVREFNAKHGIQSDVQVGDAFPLFERNMGPLMEYIEPHKGSIESAKWGDDPIGLIVNDALKRVPALSAVLTNFRGGIREGTMTAWQDFCHFPSYETPASVYRLRDHFEFVESAGPTMVFRVKSAWPQISRSSLEGWTPEEVNQAWDYWKEIVHTDRLALFMCGKAMFLTDMGVVRPAISTLEAAIASGEDVVLKKWRYLRKSRPDFVIRYRPLFDVVAA